MKTAVKSKALTEMEIKFNQIVSKTRCKIERTFWVWWSGLVQER